MSTAASGAIIVPTDDFSGTSGDTLQAYNAAWNALSGSMVITNAGRVRGAAFGSSIYSRDEVPLSADYDVRAHMTRFTSVLQIGVAARIQSSTSFYILVQAGGSWIIYRGFGSGSLVQVGSDAAIAGVGPWDIELRVRGTDLYGVVDGVDVITASDSNITAKGVPGIHAYDVATNTTGFHLDKFLVQDTQGSQSLSPAQAIWMG